MKKAVITGANGLVGTAVARYFASHGVDVLCLGRQPLSSSEIAMRFGSNIFYLNLNMDQIAELAEHVAETEWEPDHETVFFNFAWRGRERLTDGDFSDQMRNATYAAEAVRAAKKLGCSKFVNAGTLEETFVEHFLESNGDEAYISDRTNYALAKLAARDMCSIVAYLEEIDYVHTRLSVPLAPDLSDGNYIARVISHIVRGIEYEPPSSRQLFDIITTDQVARAYYLIGQKGNNKADYFIGTSRPATLQEFFDLFERLVAGITSDSIQCADDRQTRLFDVEELRRDTGFVAATDFREVVQVAPRQS